MTLNHCTERGVDYNTYKAAAQQLIHDGADVIVTAGNLAARACKDAAYPPPPDPPIPNPPAIVVASAGDLTGLADQNLTGCTNGQQNMQILQARINKMQQLNPTGVAIVGNDTVPPVQWAMNQPLQLIPQMLNGIPAYLAPFRQQSDLQNPPTIRNKLNSYLPNPNTVNVVYVCSDPLLRTHGGHFVTAAHSAPRLNTMHEFCEWYTKHGGDLCYGPDFTQLFIKAAGFVDQYFSTGTLPAVFNPGIPDCVQCP